MRHLNHRIVKWPAKGSFRISRGSLSEFITVQVQITENGFSGVAECRPYSRYNETAESVIDQIKAVANEIESGADNIALLNLLPSGAARNALDCALWDLKAKTQNRRIWELLGLPNPRSRITAFTLSLDSPENMRTAAQKASNFSVLKIKIGRDGGLERCQAVLEARPDAKLIIDANEAWDLSEVAKLSQLKRALNIVLIEQPLPARQDKSGLYDQFQNLTICADESLHTSKNLKSIWEAGYRAVNVKLDKTGGLTEALETMKSAKNMGFKVMAGCMVGSSLAMAPMFVLESFADYIDLDGPLLLSKDSKHPIQYIDEFMQPPSSQLWG